MPTRLSLSTLRGGLVVAGFVAVFSLASPLIGATVVSDPFTDGSRSNTTGGDTQGLVYYTSSTSNTSYVTNDAGGIGTGNALFLSPAAGFGKWVAQFNNVTLTNGGDLLTLQFNVRFPQGSTNLSQGLRVGLYQTFGTATIADGSTANRSDDVGYGFYTNPGTNATSTSVHGEPAGNDILGGSSPSFPTAFGTAGASFDCGTAAHLALLQIYRFTNGDLGVSARIDSGTVATGLVAAASVMTYSFNELGIALGNAVVPFLLDNISVTTTSTNITVPVNDFDALRLKWWEVLTGGTNYDLADSLVKSRIGTITNSANTQWNNLDKSPTRTYLWPDLTSTTDSGELSSAYSRIRQMSLAWSTYGSSLRSNATLAADIQGALNWMFTNRYNPTKTIYDNWYDFEIGVPINLTDIAVLMYDGLGMAGLSNSMAAVEKFTPSPTTPAAGGTSGTFTGANRADKIRAVAVRGSVVKDSAKLTAARDALSELFLYVTSGDGFYTDGSFI
ncbi:MAG: hypothetical protein HZA89_06920, partial [Verrucomicrobia bacterium]|nr:hypothetical protein [Verrucomicrobiota bacterium]